MHCGRIIISTLKNQGFLVCIPTVLSIFSSANTLHTRNLLRISVQHGFGTYLQVVGARLGGRTQPERKTAGNYTRQAKLRVCLKKEIIQTNF